MIIGKVDLVTITFLIIYSGLSKTVTVNEGRLSILII